MNNKIYLFILSPVFLLSSANMGPTRYTRIYTNNSWDPYSESRLFNLSLPVPFCRALGSPSWDSCSLAAAWDLIKFWSWWVFGCFLAGRDRIRWVLSNFWSFSLHFDVGFDFWVICMWVLVHRGLGFVGCCWRARKIFACFILLSLFLWLCGNFERFGLVSKVLLDL